MLLCGAAPPAAAAPVTRVEIRYSVSLAFLPLTLATGTLKALINPRGDYGITVNGSGIGFGLKASASGVLGQTSVHPATASMESSGGKPERRTIKLTMRNDNVRSVSVDPPVEPAPDRVPLTDASRRGVVDPVGALLLPGPANGDPMAPSRCDRTLPIYEGTERFDIHLSYARIEQVKTPTGYSGPVLVCRATYKAVAGHIKDRMQVKFMEDNRDIEAWLAPVAGTRVLMPWKVSVRTLVGTLVIEATQFVVAGGELRNGEVVIGKAADDAAADHPPSR
jgi:hypothetical protein